MTPDQIIPGHTYETEMKTRWTVISVSGDAMTAASGLPVRDSVPNFARYAVRDITPAPESDQVEKVAQATNAGACGGDGGKTPLTDLSTIAANLITCQGLPDPDEPWRPLGKRWMREQRLRSVRMGNAIAAAVAEIRKQQKSSPSAAAVNAELLEACKVFVEGYDYDRKDMIGDAFDKAVAAIARAEAK